MIDQLESRPKVPLNVGQGLAPFNAPGVRAAHPFMRLLVVSPARPRPPGPAGGSRRPPPERGAPERASRRTFLYYPSPSPL